MLEQDGIAAGGSRVGRVRKVFPVLVFLEETDWLLDPWWQIVVSVEFRAAVVVFLFEFRTFLVALE